MIDRVPKYQVGKGGLIKLEVKLSLTLLEFELRLNLAIKKLRKIQKKYVHEWQLPKNICQKESCSCIFFFLLPIAG